MCEALRWSATGTDWSEKWLEYARSCFGMLEDSTEFNLNVCRQRRR